MENRTTYIIFSILTIILTLLFILSPSSPETHYTTKESAISSLLRNKVSVLKVISVSDSREVFVFYDSPNEAIFIATICSVENKTKFIVENKTCSWKIGGEPSPMMIHGKYDVEDKTLTFYAWKNSDKLEGLIEKYKIISKNRSQISIHEEDVYLLLLLDTANA
ncbi:hypothetical protein SDC9_161594 [bioreactor metagenome]|uniref:Uncharacterized protein n=1 Tax=bioreactor metagenome TaxID=1076179 RepID=A0A645FIN9_9ZZZZ